MSCATCGCLALTISKQSAQLLQKADPCAAPNAKTFQSEWSEEVSRICPGIPLRICNTSHKHWSTRLSWTLACCQFKWDSPHQQLARFAAQIRRRHTEFAPTRRPALLPFSSRSLAVKTSATGANLLRSRSAFCPGVPACPSAPTNASEATSTPHRPWTVHRRRKCCSKRQTIVHLRRTKLELPPSPVGAAPD